MSGVDNRIVTMKFDNAQFEQGARTSMTTLGKIKSAMDFGSVGTATSKALGGISGLFAKFGIKNPFATATTGAAELQSAANQAVGGLSSFDGAVTGVSKSFIAMSTIAITALSNIVSSAMRAGTNIGKAFTIDPLSTGLAEYEQTLNATQTIMSGTGESVEQVSKTLQELNKYSDQTIYAFGDMTNNIKHFTNAGLSSEKAARVMKGIANATAAAGGSANEAARAMLGFGQSMSMGYVGLMDWNQVDNAGVATKGFKEELIKAGIAAGTLTKANDGVVKSQQGTIITAETLRTTLQDQWLSSDVLVSTLDKYSDVSTKVGKQASENATRIKTLTQLMDVLKEGVQSGWASSWFLIFGNLEQASKLWTNVSDSIGGFLATSAKARNKMLGEWNELGGRTAMLEGLGNVFSALGSILGSVRDAFRDVFPRKSGQELYELSTRFLEFSKGLKPTEGTLKSLGDTFRGVFAIFSIAGQVIGAIVGGIGKLLGAVGDGAGGILSFTGSIGNMIVEFDRFLKKSGILTMVFDSLGDALAVPIRLLAGLADILGRVFDGFDSGGISKASGAMDSFSGSADRILSIFEGLGRVLSGVSDLIVSGLSKIGYAIAGAITPETFASSLDVINTALLGGIFLMIKRFFSGGLNIDVGGGFLSGIGESLGAATEVLKNMQASLKADILLKIAGALAILAASLFLLSTIDDRDLTKALLAMGAGFLAMQFAMVSLNTAIGIIGAAKLPLIAGAMVLLATSLLILAGAMKILGGMDLYEIARGLVAISLVMTVMNKAMIPMAANAGGMIRAAAAIGIIGVALNILAVAMKIFATFNWQEMAKGLAGIVGSLTAIALAMKLMPKGMVLQAASILILSVALNALGLALKIFATMSWAEMTKGLVALAGALVLIGLGMRLMPKTLPITAAGLVLVAAALNGIAVALKVMGGMSWKEVAKGLVALGGAILILAVGLNAMGPMALAGAAALTVAAAALLVLTPVLVTLGSLGWETIIKSLTMLAGVFVLLGVAGYLLAPVVPVILGLALAMTLIGAGFALAGLGALAFATAMGIIVATGTAAVGVLAGMVGTFISSLPAFFGALGKALGKFANEISKSGPQFTRAMSTIIGSMLNAVIKNVPKMGKAFMVMLTTALKVITTMAPRIFAAGINLILGFLRAIESNIGKIVNIAASIIVKFIDGIARNIGKIIQSGVNLIIKFINGVSTAIDNNSKAMGEAGGRLAVSMVRGMANGITGAAGIIKDAAVNAAKAAFDEVKKFFKIGSPSKLMRDEVGARLPQGLALGVKDDTSLVVDEIGKMGNTAMDKLGRVMQGVDDAFSLDPNLNPTVTPVLDLSALTQEANKMSSILATAPIMAGVSYQTAADISAMTQTSAENGDGPNDFGGGGGDTYVNLEQNLHSPKPIDSVEAYRGGKTLISLAKEALK